MDQSRETWLYYCWNCRVQRPALNFASLLYGAGEQEPEPVIAGCFWVLGAVWEKNQEPEPLQKKGAGATKNITLLYQLLEEKKHKEIVHLLLFFR